MTPPAILWRSILTGAGVQGPEAAFRSLDEQIGNAVRETTAAAEAQGYFIDTITVSHGLLYVGGHPYTLTTIVGRGLKPKDGAA